MAYSLYAPYYLALTGLVSPTAAPLDIATGALPTAGRFTIESLFVNVSQGTGIGATATFSFATGFSGVGGVGVSNVTPATLTTSSGVTFPALIQPDRVATIECSGLRGVLL